jgi:hypothetical protein
MRGLRGSFPYVEFIFAVSVVIIVGVMNQGLFGSDKDRLVVTVERVCESITQPPQSFHFPSTSSELTVAQSDKEEELLPNSPKGSIVIRFERNLNKGQWLFQDYYLAKGLWQVKEQTGHCQWITLGDIKNQILGTFCWQIDYSQSEPKNRRMSPKELDELILILKSGLQAKQLKRPVNGVAIGYPVPLLAVIVTKSKINAPKVHQFIEESPFKDFEGVSILTVQNQSQAKEIVNRELKRGNTQIAVVGLPGFRF